MTDSSISEFIDGVLTETSTCGPIAPLLDVIGRTLKNHRVARDECRRTAYVTADIYPHDLNAQNGFTPTEEFQQWVREKGSNNDEPGLIIPAEFGGSAQWNNIFQQSKFMDTTALEDDKKQVWNYLMADGPNRYAEITFAFYYCNASSKFFRPSYIYYRFRLFENGKILQELANKMHNIVYV